MEKSDVVIVGGSAAGLTAAMSSRRRNSGKSVMVIRKEEKVVVPSGIPYIFGTLGNPQKNIFPDTLLTNSGVDIMIDEVREIDRDRKAVRTEGGRIIDYSKLVIATGSIPEALPIPGIEKENVFVIRKDIAYLQNMLDKVRAANDIVVIGGGFIGAEFADEFKKCGVANVTIIERLPHCLQLPFDDEFCIQAEETLKNSGINILTSHKVSRILGEKSVTEVELNSGERLKADIVIVSIGVLPNTKLAEKSGLTVSSATGGIWVDRYQHVENDKDVFACGDCSVKVSFFSGKPVKSWLASVAAGEARVAAANLFETRYPGLGTVGVFSTQIGNLALGAAGLTEKQAREDGYQLVVGFAKAPSKHPGGMPGAVPTTMKLIFSHDNGVILGGEVSGGPTAGELINVVSACIQLRMTAYEVSLFQMGTHPALSASPMTYHVVNAAEDAISKMR
jgi:pyruvate/2-oxoglutarate dehydrogenase complex dihydrolipoamide dehydrogenase (E3) component